MAIATQFCFEAAPVIAWADRLRAAGITLPVHIGVAGPAKLQTMLKFAMACGVGPSLRVLQRRAADLTRLMLPFEPTDFLTAIAEHKAAHPDFAVTSACTSSRSAASPPRPTRPPAPSRRPAGARA